MISSIIFDLDNTLVDFMKMKRAAVRAGVLAMIDAGLALTPEEAEARINAIYKERGLEYQRVFDDFLENAMGITDPRILAAGVVAYRKAREAELVPYPHVRHTLLTLYRRGIRMGVLSDAPRKEAWLRLAYLDFHHLFDAVITFDDTGERKPSPGPFQAALKALAVQPHEAIMVGDWPERDIIGAKQLGITTVFARYGYAFDTDMSSIYTHALPFSGGAVGDARPDYTIDDIAELIPLIERV